MEGWVVFQSANEIFGHDVSPTLQPQHPNVHPKTAFVYMFLLTFVFRCTSHRLFSYNSNLAVTHTYYTIYLLQGWNTSIRNISVDFIEKDSRGIITVGVAAIVRVSLKDGCFHEDCGSVLPRTSLPARVHAFTVSHVPSLARTRVAPVGCCGRSAVLSFATLSIGKLRSVSGLQVPAIPS
jgi:hypothetical protein